MPLGRSARLPNVTQANRFPATNIEPPLTIPGSDGSLLASLTEGVRNKHLMVQFNSVRGTRKMLCKKHPPIRNLINLSDPRQVRTLKRRLGVSGAELARVVEKAGNSIAAITKEVELEKTHDAPTNTDSATS